MGKHTEIVLKPSTVTVQGQSPNPRENEQKHWLEIRLPTLFCIFSTLICSWLGWARVMKFVGFNGIIACLPAKIDFGKSQAPY